MITYKLTDDDIETLKLMKKFSDDEALIKFVEHLIECAYQKGIISKCENDLDNLIERIKKD